MYIRSVPLEVLGCITTAPHVLRNTNINGTTSSQIMSIHPAFTIPGVSGLDFTGHCNCIYNPKIEGNPKTLPSPHLPDNDHFPWSSGFWIGRGVAALPVIIDVIQHLTDQMFAELSRRNNLGRNICWILLRGYMTC